MSTVPAYPLTWPAGWKRIEESRRIRAKFHGSSRQYSSQPNGGSWLQKRPLTIAEGTQRITSELRSLGVLDGDSIISTNLRLRLDGLPRGDQGEPKDPGVAVYWQRPTESMKCMAIDIYDRVADNLAAVAATLDAMRAIERHGGAAILDRAFTGFTALPAPGGTVAKGWREVLGFRPDETPKYSEVEAAYKRLRSTAHPDREGGSHEQFMIVQTAFDHAHAEIGT